MSAVVSTEKLRADDTPAPVLCPGLGNTKNGRLWTRIGDDRPAGSSDPPAVLCRYSPDRKGWWPRQHLASFNGVLQPDGYAGLERLYGERIQRAGWWAAALRKFYDLHLVHAAPTAKQPFPHVGELNATEADIRDRPREERVDQRRARAVPLLAALHNGLYTSLGSPSKRSELAVAIRCALSRLYALTRYRDDGRHESDNDVADRALRGRGHGRRN